jgi:hypothetical protein
MGLVPSRGVQIRKGCDEENAWLRVQFPGDIIRSFVLARLAVLEIAKMSRSCRHFYWATRDALSEVNLMRAAHPKMLRCLDDVKRRCLLEFLLLPTTEKQIPLPSTVTSFYVSWPALPTEKIVIFLLSGSGSEELKTIFATLTPGVG